MMRMGWLLLWSVAAFSQADPKASQGIPISGPSGPYTIGRVSYDWVDSSRPETLSKIPDTPREIVVDVWYPAAQPQPNLQPAPYFPNAGKIDQSPYAEAEIRGLGNLWPMIISGKVQSHAYDGAPIAPDRPHFPLLIFSPAIGGEPYVYAHQIEELVSHGFIVATVHHTYEAAVTVFPDGRMVPLSEANFQRSRVNGPEDISNERKWEDERFDVWAGDMRFTLDQITRLNTAPESRAPFAGRVDLARVGVFGHSFGGIAVGRACELDQRFKACLKSGRNGRRWASSALPRRPPADSAIHVYALTAARTSQRRRA